jgi:TolA-binding protein
VTSGAQAQTVREAQTFLRRFPQSAQRPQVLFWSAEAFYATQAYRDALTAYQSLLREAPKSPYTATTLHRLGLSYVYSRAVEAALRTITQLLAQFPGDKETDQIIFLMATSHFEQSQEVLQVRYQLGTIALVQKQYDSAQQHYRAVAQAASGPLVVQAHYALAWLFVHQGQIAQAVAYLRRQGLLAQPTTTDTALAQGYDLLLLQHYEEAIPLLTNAAATWQYEASSAEWKALLLLEPPGPRRGEVLWRLGRDLLALKQYRETRDHLLQVVSAYAAEPYARLAAWALQRCLLELQQYREALEYLPGFWRHDPRRFFTLEKQFAAGKQLLEAKQYAPARRIFQELLDQPFTGALTDDAEFMVAESYLAEGNTCEALRYYRLVAQHGGASKLTALAHYRAGIVLQQARQFAEAALALAKAVEQTTHAGMRGQALYHLGKAYMALHQQENARAVFNPLLRDGLPVSASSRLTRMIKAALPLSG